MARSVLLRCDPSLYDGLETLIGDVMRNVMFKALLRYTMENEQRPRAQRRPEVTERAGGMPRE